MKDAFIQKNPNNFKMNRTKLFLSTLIFFIFTLDLHGQPEFQCDGAFYVNRANKLYALNFNWETGETNLTAFPGDLGFTRMGALAYNRVDNYIYGIGEANGETYFLRIDATGNGSVLDTLEIDGWEQAFAAGGISNDGKYFIFFLTIKQTVTPGVPSSAIGVIDLETPDFKLEIRPLKSQVGEFPLLLDDFAFDPVTDSIYSYSKFPSDDRKLIFVNKDAPIFDNSFFPTSDKLGILSLFFDPFGQLWGITTNKLFKINTVSGVIEEQIISDISAFDGCSCPYTIGFQKKVSIDTAFACSNIQYTFVLSNLTEKTQNNLQFKDDFPPDFEITEILSNPFGGTVQGVGTNILTISGMGINRGVVDSIMVRIQTPPDGNGLYFNQAVLSNVDLRAGNIQANTLLSDNPATLELKDPTPVFIRPLETVLVNQTIVLCQDSTVELSPLSYPNDFQYEWSDGSTANSLEVSIPGNYSVTITSGCSSNSANYEVRLSELSVLIDVPEEFFFGESYELMSLVNGSFVIQSYFWEFGDTSILSIQPRLEIRPEANLSIRLTVTDQFGCLASDEGRIRVLRKIYTPNAFSPNGDGINDWFFIQTPSPIPINRMQIFDRWGGLVFERTNIFTNAETDGWDGRQNNQILENGPYIWWAELDFGDQRKEMLKGEVLIVK